MYWFAFINGRNQPSLSLLGFTVDEDAFFEAAQDREDIIIDVPDRKVTVAGQDFHLKLSDTEYNLTVNNRVAESYKKFGSGIWETFTKEKTSLVEAARSGEDIRPHKDLDW